MSLPQALATAVAGLRVNAGRALARRRQRGERRDARLCPQDRHAGRRPPPAPIGVGVRIAAINRELDQYIQRQMRMESSGASYAGLRAQFYRAAAVDLRRAGRRSARSRPPTTSSPRSLQALTTSPESASARSAVLSAAQVLAQQLNGMTADIQALRSDAELGLADAVARANEAMQRIAQINRQLAHRQRRRRDHRDAARPARRLYRRARAADGHQRRPRPITTRSSVFTNSGIQLVGIEASTLAFDPQGTMTPAAQWSADPSQRSVGTIVADRAERQRRRSAASNAIRSGEIAAYLEMRDEVLVQAQTQLDEIAAAMARALSDRTIDGTAVTPGRRPASTSTSAACSTATRSA